MSLDFEMDEEEKIVYDMWTVEDDEEMDFDSLLQRYMGALTLLLERTQEIARLQTQLVDVGCKCGTDCKCRSPGIPENSKSVVQT